MNGNPGTRYLGPAENPAWYPLKQTFAKKKNPKIAMPSRASAVRELLKRGLAADGFVAAGVGVKSEDFGVTEGAAAAGRAENGADS